ncbi:META domain-containing protein [Oryzobacter terrae]|uniref:META domain-containing protein n=1 Tax=Oryzobacter terrae TaxID=1620385 RepID=UPI00366DB08A
MARTTTRMTTALAIGGVLAAVAVGVVAATTIWDPGADDTANGSVPVERLSALDGSWRAVNSVGSPKEVVGEVRLRFEDGRVVVETGCNAGRGTVEVDDSHLVAGPMMSTRMGCEAPLMEQEAWLFAMMQARPKVELSGPYLYVSWTDTAGEDRWLGLEQESATPTP